MLTTVPLPKRSFLNPFRVMNTKLAKAMAAYGALIALAFYLLHGKFLYAVLLFFGLLIAKTLIAVKAGW
jgi:hypothetical protein